MPRPVEERAPGLEEQPPDWTAVPDPGPTGSQPAAIAARNAIAAVVVAAVLWLLGHHLPALVLLLVLAAATATSLRFPSVAAALELATRTIQRLARRLLTLVLLGVLELLVFAPASLLFRLFRHDPLTLGRAPRGRSLWRPVPSRPGRPLYRRQFTYERVDEDDGAGRRPVARLREVLGLLALLVALDVGVGALLHAGGSGDAGTSGPRQSLLLNPDAAAGRGAPWLRTLADEIDHVWYASRYDPYLGWTAPSFDGLYLHTAARMRQSYEPPASPGHRALRVFFFGGSTMFGLFQRDQYTIPSDVARLAQADGISLRVYNYGELAYNNWQELLLLEELVSQGHRPDVAVFYDGVNDLVSQFQYGPHTAPSNLEAGDFAKRIGVPQRGSSPKVHSSSSPLAQLYRAWENVSALVWLWHRLRGEPTAPTSTAHAQTLVSPWVANQQQATNPGGRDAALLLNRGVTLAQRVGATYGFPTAFFLQPMLYSKPVVNGEQPEVGSLGTDPNAWRRAYAVFRSDLQPPVFDIADAFDSVKTPMFYDFVHTNELGAQVVARALYAHLKPTLGALYRRRRR